MQDEPQPHLSSLHQLLVENVQDFAIIAFGLDGTILTWNQGAERVFGWSAAEIVGQDAALLFTPEDRATGVPALEMRKSREQGRADDDRWMIRKDGTRFFASGAMTPIRDGVLRGYAKVCRDATERRRVTEALRESEARLRQLADNLPSGFIYQIIQGPADAVHYTYVSGGIEALLGVAPAEVEADAHTMHGLILEEDLPRVRSQEEEAYRQMKPFDCRFRVRTRSGSVLWMQCRSAPRPLEGERTVWDGIAMDITERVEAALAVQRSEARHRALAEATSKAVWAWRDGKPSNDNAQAENWWKTLTGQQQGNWLEAVHPEDRAAVEATWDAAVASGSAYDALYRVRARKGGWRHIRARGVPVPGTAINEWIGTLDDVTGRVHREEVARFLAEASAELAELADYEAILQRIAALAVPRFADWCAVDMVQPGGLPRRLAVMHADPDKVRLAYEIHRKFPHRLDDPSGVPFVFRTSEPEWVSEISDAKLETLARDAEHLRILRELGLKSYICVPLLSRDGLLGALTFVMAESGRFYDHEDLCAAQDLASRAVVAIENAKLLAALKEAGRRKDQFMAMLAHELRNPLAPIRNSLHVLRLRAGDWSVVEQVRGMMERQVIHLGRLVDDLLDVSRITLGKVQLRRERLDLGQLAVQGVEAHRAAFTAARVGLSLTCPEAPAWVEGDGTRLAQVLDNLLANALKFTPVGGEVGVTVSTPGRSVTLAVQDSGAGIEPAMLPLLFETFSQADRTLDRSQGGLGLGLAIVRGLAELHGGTVRAESAGLGQGACFTVSLPHLTETGTDAPSEGRASREEAGLRILVVDDSRDAAESLQLLLDAVGHSVVVAYSGADGVRAAKEHHPEVVICDIGLPGMDGYRVAEALRGDPATAKARLIALTGYGQNEDRRRALEAGFDEHLTKPADLATLKAVLRACSS